MKKMLFLLMGAAAVSAFGGTTTTQLGTVGVTAITTSLSNAIVAVSYDDLTEVSGIVVSNFVKTTNLDAGDRLVVFKDGEYTSWTLQDGTGGAKYWAKNEKTFTVGPDGQETEGKGTPASGVTETVGTGIWLVRQNPIDANGNTNSFYIYGKPASSKTSTTEVGKWTLIGNPTQTQKTIGMEVGENIVVVEKAAEGDELVVPVEPDGHLLRYMFNSTYGWRAKDHAGKWDNGNPPKLAGGLGCWILTKKSNASITWDNAQ